MISPGKRRQVVAELRKGKSCRQVMSDIGVSKSTVSRIRRTLDNFSSISKGGRPKKLSPRDTRSCFRAVTVDAVKSAGTVARQLDIDYGIKCSAQTVRRALKSLGLKAKKKIIKPALSAKNKKERLAFAKSHIDWTTDDWKRVIFSDETKINRFCSDGLSWCWVPQKIKFSPAQISPTMKHGGGSLMMWGCITYKGPGFACKIEGNMDQHLYKQILEDELLQTMEYYDLEKSAVIFMQDNDPKHKAKSVMEWLKLQEFSLLVWPAQSPDLNPIENIWSNVKQKLARYDHPPTSMAELWERASSIFNNISEDECSTLIESMPRRMAAVIKSKGSWTKY